MGKNHVIAYDLGTGGVKASLVDFDGNICCIDVKEYPLYSPYELWAEQEAEDYWRAVCAATKEVLKKAELSPECVKGAAFCTQWKGIIPLDAKGNVLNRNITWLDGRAEPQAEAMSRSKGLKECYKALFLGPKLSAELNDPHGEPILNGKDYVPKLLWLKENMPGVYEKTVCILECNSYIKWRATGNRGIDLTNHFTRSFSESKQKYLDYQLSMCGIDPELFPEIKLPTQLAGYITPGAGEELGLRAGTPIFHGFGDIPAIAVGSGCGEPGDTHAYFGSSGWMASMIKSEEDFIDVSPFSPEHDLLIVELQSIGLSFDWTVSQFYRREKEEMGSKIYPFIETELRDVPAGSQGLLATHWLHGERPPFFGNDARGMFLNIGSRHDRRHFLNAMMEGVCYSMRMSKEMLEKNTGRNIKSLRTVGGGTLNGRWMQILADVLQVPVRVPTQTRHCGTLGAAYCALIGLGVCRNFSEAKKHIRIEKEFFPRRENFAAHNKMYAQYKGLYTYMRPLILALR